MQIGSEDMGNLPMHHQLMHRTAIDAHAGRKEAFDGRRTGKLENRSAAALACYELVS